HARSGDLLFQGPRPAGASMAKRAELKTECSTVSQNEKWGRQRGVYSEHAAVMRHTLRSAPGSVKAASPFNYFFFGSTSNRLRFGGAFVPALLVSVTFVLAVPWPVSRLPTPLRIPPVFSPTFTPSCSATPTPVLRRMPPTASSLKSVF